MKKRAERLARRKGLAKLKAWLSLAELDRCGIRTQLAQMSRMDNHS